MANTFSPFGFRQFGRQDGGAPTAGLTRLFIASSDSNSYFTGDLVAYSSASGASTTLGTQYVTLATSGSVPLSPLQGVFLGCEYYSPSVGRVVWNSYYPTGAGAASSSPVTAYVCTDPEQLYIVQSTTTASITSTSIGLNIGFASSLQSAGNTTTGVSNLAVNSSTPAGTNTLPFRIVDLYSNYAPPGANGTDNTAAGVILVVAPNNFARKSLTATTT